MRLFYNLMSGKLLRTRRTSMADESAVGAGQDRRLRPLAGPGTRPRPIAYRAPNYDDPQNWANEMAVETTGKMPDFGK